MSTKKTEVTKETEAQNTNPEVVDAATEPQVEEAAVLTPEEALAQLEAEVEEQKKRNYWIAGGIAAGSLAIGVGLGWLLFGRD